MPYRIVNWQKHYETAKSRTIDSLSWVAIPNRQDGRSYRFLLRHSEGPDALLAFIATVQRCSRFSRSHRDGWLTDDGTAAGRPWDADDLEMMTDIPAAHFEMMFKLCSDPKIGWIECQKYTGSIPGVYHEDTGSIPGVYHEDTTGTRSIHIREGGKEGNIQEGGRMSDSDVVSFSLWYEEYPSKVGRKVAEKAWKAANDKPTLEVMLDKLAQQKTTRKWREGIIPNPATYLNQGRWDDEVAPDDGEPYTPDYAK